MFTTPSPPLTKPAAPQKPKTPPNHRPSTISAYRQNFRDDYYHLAQKAKKEPLFANMEKTLQCKPFLNKLVFIMFFTVSGNATQSFGLDLMTYCIFTRDLNMASLFGG